MEAKEDENCRSKRLIIQSEPIRRAECVVGAEMSQHLCDVAVQTVVANGFAATCRLLPYSKF